MRLSLVLLLGVESEGDPQSALGEPLHAKERLARGDSPRDRDAAHADSRPAGDQPAEGLVGPPLGRGRRDAYQHQAPALADDPVLAGPRGEPNGELAAVHRLRGYLPRRLPTSPGAQA